MNIVEIQNLTKTYETVTALDGISVEIQKGELFGFIGPDGAGKSTLFRILTTLIKPDSGSVKVFGMDIVDEYRAIRSRLGYMPGRFSLYEDLSVRENIDFFASVFGTTLNDNYELVAPVYGQIERFESRLAGDLSGGMKQKLALSCALIHKPDLLILDEPTTGVDAVSRQEFWQMLKHLRGQGLTIIASTPYMDEATRCDRVALINRGEILRIDTPSQITNAYRKPLLAVKADNRYRLLKKLRSYDYAHSVQPFGEYVHFTDRRDEPHSSQLMKYLEDAGFENIEVKPVEAGIEDSFIALMQDEKNSPRSAQV